MDNASTNGSESRIDEVKSKVASTVLLCIVCLGLCANIFTILMISKSDLFRSFCGAFLVNQTLSDCGFLAVSVTFVLPQTGTIGHFTETTGILLRWLAVGFVGASAHSQAATCINMYMAICQHQKYKVLITKRRVCIFFICSWAFNASFLALYDVKPNIYLQSVTFKIMTNYSYQTWWMGALVMANNVGFPLVTSLCAFTGVSMHTRGFGSARLNINSARKYKLAKMILIDIAVFVSTYVPLHVFESVQNSIIVAITTFLHYIYHIIKLCLFLKFYPPLRTVCITMLRRRGHRVVSVVTVSPETDNVSTF